MNEEKGFNKTVINWFILSTGKGKQYMFFLNLYNNKT